MLIPIIISAAFVLAVDILCITKPNPGRIFLGLFFLFMSLGVNGYFTLTNSHAYVEYASHAIIPFYLDVALTVVRLNPSLFGWSLILFETTMGFLLLHKHASVKIGLIGTAGFLMAIAPLSFVQIPWLGLVIGQTYLLKEEFNSTFLEIISPRLRPRRVYESQRQKNSLGKETVSK